MDVTIRGPTRGKEGLYGKYTSLYSPVSFLNVIRSTYPVISNGVVREFRVAEGEFRDPIQWKKIARVLAQFWLEIPYTEDSEEHLKSE